MDFELTDEQRAVRQLARKLFTRPERDESCAREDWSALARAQLLGVALPEAVGGGGLGFIELCLLIEQAGEAASALPLVSALVGAGLPLAREPRSARSAELLNGLCRGERTLCASFGALGTPALTAHREADGWRVNGAETCVAGLPLADAILLAVRIDGARVAGHTAPAAPSTQRLVAPHAPTAHEAVQAAPSTRPSVASPALTASGPGQAAASTPHPLAPTAPSAVVTAPSQAPQIAAGQAAAATLDPVAPTGPAAEPAAAATVRSVAPTGPAAEPAAAATVRSVAPTGPAAEPVAAATVRSVAPTGPAAEPAAAATVRSVASAAGLAPAQFAPQPGATAPDSTRAQRDGEGPLDTDAGRDEAGLASTAGGCWLFLVDRDTHGLQVEPQTAASGHPLGLLQLRDVVLSDEQLLIAPARAQALIDWTLERVYVAQCAYELGLCSRALQMTARFASERQQFGRAIGTFQAVAQRVADAHVAIETLRLTTWRAAWLLDRGRAAQQEVAVARVLAAEVGASVMSAAQHIHGSAGVDRSYPLHRYFLASQLNGLTLGGHGHHLTRLGRMLAEHRSDTASK